MKIPERLKSRKLWITIGYFVVEILNRKFALGLDDALEQMRPVVIAGIAGLAAVDIAENLAPQ